MSERFTITKRPYVTPHNSSLFLPTDWGFKEDEIVHLKVETLDGSKTFEDMKRVCKSGKRTRVFLRKDWWLEGTRMYTFTVWRVGDD